MNDTAISLRLGAWWEANARDLPWRFGRATPWGVLVSEVMSQQTQMSRVVPYWTDWMERWPDARALAVLPGSRPGEIRRLAEPLAQAAARLRAEGHAGALRMILAPALSPEARALAEAAARRAGIPLLAGDPAHGAAPLLGAFDLSLCASGTASLEAALAGAAPVVAYRLDPLSHALARMIADPALFLAQ
mgnify:CR=1 FL=1